MRAKSGAPAPVAAVAPLGDMLPGAAKHGEGRVLDFAIQKTTGSGAVTGFDPASKENFSGTYVGIKGIDANIVTATAYLRGDKGAALTCDLKSMPPAILRTA